MRKLTLIFFILACSSQVIGQIANIENKRKSQREEGFSGNINIDFSYVKNLEEIYQFGGTGRLYYFKKQHGFMLLGDSKVVQTDGEDLVNNNFEHVRYNLALDTARIFVFEAFEQLQQNRVQNIDLRALAGSGMRFSLASTDSIAFYLGVSGMYEYEESTESTEIERNWRASSYLSADWQATENFGMNLIVYYQPVFKDFQDYRISGEFALRLKISEKLRFVSSVNLVYDNRPLPNIPNNIINVSNGLRYNFN
ncbi:DUF481 domain-containing protein [Halocola ammonii]